MNTKKKSDFSIFTVGNVGRTSEIIHKYIVKTPVRRLSWLEKIIKVPVYLKLESQQITGSFKYRGALSKLLQSSDNTTIVAASAGNHGLAVAEASRVLHRVANICVPISASPLKKERIRQLGAGLIENGGSVEEATDHALSLAQRHGWS